MSNIKEEVVHLFEHYGVNCIPINGFELAYKLGIRLIPYSTLSKAKRSQLFGRPPNANLSQFWGSASQSTEVIQVSWAFLLIGQSFLFQIPVSSTKTSALLRIWKKHGRIRSRRRRLIDYSTSGVEYIRLPDFLRRGLVRPDE